MISSVLVCYLFGTKPLTVITTNEDPVHYQIGVTMTERVKRVTNGTPAEP